MRSSYTKCAFPGIYNQISHYLSYFDSCLHATGLFNRMVSETLVSTSVQSFQTRVYLRTNRHGCLKFWCEDYYEWIKLFKKYLFI